MRARWVVALLWLAGCGAPAEPRAPRPRTEELPEPRVPSSFEHSKRLAAGVYRDHRVTLYCGCTYDRRRRIEPEACGYEPRRVSRRARRVEWEHLVPAYAFGHQRACWRAAACSDHAGRAFGGRRCCRETDAEFRRMEADLQNLSPEIGELNADRSSFSFSEVSGEARRYGACDFEVDRAARAAEPPPAVRGDVARAYLYMYEVYGPRALPLDAPELARFRAWHDADPPDAWERLRDARITAIQGVGNPFMRR